MEGQLPCRLSFLDDDRVEYQDWVPRRASGLVDRSGLVWRTAVWLSERLSGEGRRDRREVELLGRHLYELAFGAAPDGPGETIRKSFEDTLDLFRRTHPAADERVRIELVFHPRVETLAQLPWEFLFMPAPIPGTFLAREGRLILTRHVPDIRVSDPRLPDKPVLLAADCQAEGMTPVSPDGVLPIPLGTSPEEAVIDVRRVHNPTYEELRRSYASTRPELLHLIAHGKDEGILVRPSEREIRDHQAERDMADAARNPDPGKLKYRTVSATDLKNIFGDHLPELVFLQSCKGDAQTRQGVFSTARQLVNYGVAAVVAMQYAIGNNAAQVFAHHFYQAIGEGRSVGEAVRLGRCALGEVTPGTGEWDDRAFGTPVLYLQRKEDGPLVRPMTGQRARSLAATHRASPEAADHNYCVRCGHPIGSADVFCAKCGLRLPDRAPAFTLDKK